MSYNEKILTDLIKATKNNFVIYFDYQNNFRIGEPHTIYINENEIYMLFFQTSGESKSEVKNWKKIKISEITNLQMTTSKFSREDNHINSLSFKTLAISEAIDEKKNNFELEKEIIFVKSLSRKFEHVGSTITCNPPPENTDKDYLALIPSEEIENIRNYLNSRNWEVGGSTNGYEHIEDLLYFESYIKRDRNIIITTQDVYFNKFHIATHLAKDLNVLKKGERIILFGSILYNIPSYHYII